MLTLYSFLPAQTTGTSTVDGQSVDLDLDFSEAAELLDGAVSGRIEAWNGDWGLVFDGNYVSLGIEGSLSFRGPAGQSDDVDVDIEQYWLSFLAAYKVVDNAYGSGQRFALDLQGGARYNSLRQKVDISGPGPGADLGGTET